jgi:hypothetical protein
MEMRSQHLHILIPLEDARIERLPQHTLASVRMRSALAASAAQSLGWRVTVGETVADVPSLLLVGKIGSHSIAQRAPAWLHMIKRSRRLQRPVWVDYTDHHCGVVGPMTEFYRSALQLADQLVTPSRTLASLASPWWAGSPVTIRDPFEVNPRHPQLPSSPPWRMLWFGSNANIGYLCAFLESSENTSVCRSLNIVTNAAGQQLFLSWAQRRGAGAVIPAVTFFDWSVANLEVAAQTADIAVIPSDATDPRKTGVSENRLITALMLGLPTVATRLPSYQPYAEYFVSLETGWRDALLKRSVDLDSQKRARAYFIDQFSKTALESQWREALSAVPCSSNSIRVSGSAISCSSGS